MSDLEDEFVDIAQEAIVAAEHVNCSLEEFRDGLKAMKAEIDMRINAVEDELNE
jgi:hypothetical protein